VQPGGRFNETNFVIQPDGQSQQGSPEEVERALRRLYENHMVKPQKTQLPFVDLTQPNAPKENGNYTDEVAALKARHSTGGFPSDEVYTPEAVEWNAIELFEPELTRGKPIPRVNGYSFQHDIKRSETEYIEQPATLNGNIRYLFNPQNKLVSVVQETFDADGKQKISPLPKPDDKEMEQKLRQFIHWGNKYGFRPVHE
jgi:hypothetical protein